MLITKVNGQEASDSLIQRLELERKDFFEGFKEGLDPSHLAYSHAQGVRDTLTLAINDDSTHIELPLRAYQTMVNEECSSPSKSFEERFRFCFPTHLLGSQLVDVFSMPYEDFFNRGKSDPTRPDLFRLVNDSKREVLASWKVREQASTNDPIPLISDDFLGLGSDISVLGYAQTNTLGSENNNLSKGNETFLNSIFPGVDVDPSSVVRVEERTLLNGNSWYRLSFGLNQGIIVPSEVDKPEMVFQSFKHRYMDLEVAVIKRQPLNLVYDGFPKAC
jgi:hypothetical protein